jgi:hypothetical protein
VPTVYVLNDKRVLGRLSSCSCQCLKSQFYSPSYTRLETKTSLSKVPTVMRVNLPGLLGEETISVCTPAPYLVLTHIAGDTMPTPPLSPCSMISPHVLQTICCVLHPSKSTLPFSHLLASRARLCKRLRSPGIDSKESITPAYVDWRPVRQIGLSYRPAMLHKLATSIPWIDSWAP